MTRVFSAATLSSALVPTGIAMLTAMPVAQARVTQVQITAAEQPAYGGKSFGDVGAYERVSGQIMGEVDPNDRRNAIKGQELSYVVRGCSLPSSSFLCNNSF